MITSSLSLSRENIIKKEDYNNYNIGTATNLSSYYGLFLEDNIKKYEHANLTIAEIEYELKENRIIPLIELRKFSNQLKDVTFMKVFSNINVFDGDFVEGVRKRYYLLRLYNKIKKHEKKFKGLMAITNLQHVN
ncbi:MAG: hypothetical protein JW974_02620 [Alphaproteobacteria bacterium]|nr:hypothetical protein [Alphaproteobacteria bacterium]MBN2675545.1 hypothetical protein [Alphaproteobacteria bacterium]